MLCRRKTSSNMKRPNASSTPFVFAFASGVKKEAPIKTTRTCLYLPTRLRLRFFLGAVELLFPAITITHSFRGRQYHIAKFHRPMIALQIKRAGRAFIAIERSAGDTRYFLIADNSFSV